MTGFPEGPTLDVLPKAHGGGDRLTFAVRFLLHDVIVAGRVIGTELFLLFLLVARGQFLGEGEHGEDDEQHGYCTK